MKMFGDCTDKIRHGPVVVIFVMNLFYFPLAFWACCYIYQNGKN